MTVLLIFLSAMTVADALLHVYQAQVNKEQMKFNDLVIRSVRVHTDMHKALLDFLREASKESPRKDSSN